VTRTDGFYRTGLIVFGVLEILVGVLIGVMAATLAGIALGAFRDLPDLMGSGGTSATLGTGALVYGALAAVMVAIGIGSLLLRRWVRPLVLYIATLWLLCGVLILLILGGIAASSGLLSGAPDADEPPLGLSLTPIGLGLFACVIVVLYVAIPAAMLLFHRSRGLREALERLDPKTRWTDRCPPPVLSLSLSLAISAAGCLPFIRGPLPLFGATLAGPAAAVVVGLAAIALAVLAVLTYRLAPSGWWGSLAMVVIVTLISVDVSFRVDLTRAAEDAFAGAGAPPPTPETAATAAWLLGAGSLLFGVVCLVAVLRLRRYFFAPRPALSLPKGR
jgi:hypothetical protein